MNAWMNEWGPTSPRSSESGRRGRAGPGPRLPLPTLPSGQHLRMKERVGWGQRLAILKLFLKLKGTLIGMRWS